MLPNSEQWDAAAFPFDQRRIDRINEWLCDETAEEAAAGGTFPGMNFPFKKNGDSVAKMLPGFREAIMGEYIDEVMHRDLRPINCFCGNTVGYHDMFSNVWEWCDSWAQPELGSLPPSQFSRRAAVIIKGGPVPADSCPIAQQFTGFADRYMRFERLGLRICITKKTEEEND
jgi:formylglycine-generating enzyme required for sulfatase activity